MNCPTHKEFKLRQTKGWAPPDGYDPKMVRLSCILCADYWYKAPKKCAMRWEEVEQLTFPRN